MLPLVESILTDISHRREYFRTIKSLCNRGIINSLKNLQNSMFPFKKKKLTWKKSGKILRV